MTKKTIFLSHISEEGALGTLFKNRLEKDFLSLIDVFVSSDSRSIPPGDAWLKAVDENLSRAAALIVLASPSSVIRPWITFEAGAGWAKRVPTMILCHSGITPGGLPLPLGQLQAFVATDAARIRAMYGVVAGVLGSATPDPDLGDFVDNIAAFEKDYTEERDVLLSLRDIQSHNAQVILLLKQVSVGQPTPLRGVPETPVTKIEKDLNQLAGRGLLSWSFGVSGIGFAAPGSAGGGSFGDLVVTVSPNYAFFQVIRCWRQSKYAEARFPLPAPGFRPPSPGQDSQATEIGHS